MIHNEITCARGANCLNDVTKVLEVSSRKKSTNTETTANLTELQMLGDFDIEYGLDYEPSDKDETVKPINVIESLQEISLAYMAGIVEAKVIHTIAQRGKMACKQCMDVFTENDLADDNFIDFKSKTSDILQPCKSTLKIMQYAESALKKYSTLNASFQSVLKHIVDNMDVSNLYGLSVFDETHDHRSELTHQIIMTYLDLRSKNGCKIITRLSQGKRIRHEKNKSVHRAGQ